MNVGPTGTIWWTDLWIGVGHLFVNVGNSIRNGITNIVSSTTDFVGELIGGVSDSLTSSNVGLEVLLGISKGGILGQNSIGPL